MEKFEQLFENYMSVICSENPDPSHDILHACVYVSKVDERRTQASRISDDKAIALLNEWGYPVEFLPAIHHAISAHSFSAKIETETIETQVVQDADRLDAMGATGIFRCFAFSGLAK